ncbi:MAG: 16S rRNA (cytosine(967)-C(5))-methyltransferase RsmB [Chloroherpetonaceae bacterium]|nr:16S rRNA (cytosine(967)-C(5))-methyltransferase RsmB [Chloroherpetonaceae bacterium]
MTAREVAIKVLKDVELGRSKSDTALNSHFHSANLESLDKAFTMHVVYGTLREKMKIDFVIQQFYRHDYQKVDIDIKNILRIGVYQLLFLNKVPKWAAVNESVELAKRLKNQFLGNLVNGVLRNVANNLETITFTARGGTFADQISLQYSHPKWLLERWIQRFSLGEAQDLMTANNAVPRLSFRINSLKTTFDEMRKLISEKGVAFQETVMEEFISAERFYDFDEFMSQGLLSVQSESQGIACKLLDPKPGEAVLDMCAAPGGKSTYLAEMMNNKGKVLSLDIYLNKLKDIQTASERLGISIIETLKVDARIYAPEEKFDRVLVDAPCTGTGVLGKRAELRWRLSPNDIIAMSRLQEEILTNAATCVKPNGELVYSTCSLEPEENMLVVRKFLATHPDWKIMDARDILQPSLHQFINQQGAVEILPHVHHYDGAFSIRLHKGNS